MALWKRYLDAGPQNTGRIWICADEGKEFLGQWKSPGEGTEVRTLLEVYSMHSEQ